MGATPVSFANAASERIRSMFCPAVMTSWAAVWGPTWRSARRVGTGLVEPGLARSSSASAISVSRCWIAAGQGARSARLVAWSRVLEPVGVGAVARPLS